MRGRAGGRRPGPPEVPPGAPRGSRWSVLGAAGGHGAMAIDGAGRIVTGRNGWSLGWEVLAGTSRVVPGDGSAVRQRAAGGGGAAPAGLETVVRAGGGEVGQLAYVCVAAAAGAGALGVVDLRNDTPAPVAVRLSVQPGDFWRGDGSWRVQAGDAGVHVNGMPALWWERPPAEVRVAGDAAAILGPAPEAALAPGAGGDGPRLARSRRGRAGATLTWPVTHGTALRVLLPLHAGAAGPPAPAGVPTPAQVAGGWDTHAAAGLRVDGLASDRVAAVAAAAVRRLLALDFGPEASSGPDGRFPATDRAVLAAALAVAGFPERAAEAAPVRAARRPGALARLARREAARIAASFDRGPAAVGAMAASAGPGGGWASDRSGDDPVYRAAYLLGLADLLVAERDGDLDLLAGLGATADLAAVRPPVEVHRLGTAAGSLSFALRWHGAVPALLWEIVPPANRLESWAAALAGAGGGDGAGADLPSPPRLTAGALDAAWSTRQLAGEALLRP